MYRLTSLVQLRCSFHCLWCSSTWIEHLLWSPCSIHALMVFRLWKTLSQRRSASWKTFKVAKGNQVTCEKGYTAQEWFWSFQTGGTIGMQTKGDIRLGNKKEKRTWANKERANMQYWPRRPLLRSGWRFVIQKGPKPSKKTRRCAWGQNGSFGQFSVLLIETKFSLGHLDLLAH